MRADGVPVSDQAVEALDHLDARLDAMSGGRNAELCTEAALSDDPRWSDLRHSARHTLQHLL
jgi:enamine deaminase RidA (YjgF/YER057c/UK114 family)